MPTAQERTAAGAAAGPGIDPARIGVTIDRGVLHVSVKRRESAQPRRIQVR